MRNVSANQSTAATSSVGGISIAARLRDIFFPPRCPCCDYVLLPEERPAGFCRFCAPQITRVQEPVCKKCGKPIDDAAAEYCYDCRRAAHVFTQGKGLFVYAGRMKDAMYRFKYSNRRCYRRVFAAEAVRRYGGWIGSAGVNLIVPVPMYARKQRQRGYNQAYEFAKELGKLTGIPATDRILLRTRSTKPQKTLNDRQRHENLRGAFGIHPAVLSRAQASGGSPRTALRGCRFLLVDDIYTTGTTCDYAAQALLDAGADAVFCMYICVGRGLS